MRLLVYGTLLDSAILATRAVDPALPRRCRDAVLRGWRRVRLTHTRWPTLRRSAGGVVAGKIRIASAAALRRLAAYEGPLYRFRRVVVEPRTPAWTWIAPGGTRNPWRVSGRNAIKGVPMISYDLAGKTALVTGGASGIGFATARMLAKFGATVAINFLADDPRGPEAVNKLIDEGGKAIIAPGNVGDADDAEKMVLKAVADLGRLDLLVNNAGTPGTSRRIAPPDLELITEELWNLLLNVNLLGVFRCAKAAAPALTEAHGAIVNTASIAGLGRAGSSLAYSATKAGVVSLTQNLARALGPNVRVNAIAPGAVDSSWMVEWTNQERQQSIERALLKRRCQPEDLAEVILFLGFGAAMVTGQTITVDGGLTL